MASQDRPAVICLTPVRNEAWILDLFLRCASLWADRIIVADQGSTDGSREIASRFEKVTLIDNPSGAFNEAGRQRMLIEAARRIPGRRLLVALDADEIFTPELFSGAEWGRVLASPPGTAVHFNWANLRPGFQRFWSPQGYIPFAFMDDGSEHRPLEIHSPRVPVCAGGEVIRLQQVKVMHYQYTHWERMRSKHRWYQCWERINHPERSAVSIFRQYHHMFAVPDAELRAVPRHWIEEYSRLGIDVTGVSYETGFYWDALILEFLQHHGASRFAQEAIWDVDWVEKGRLLGLPDPERFADPRSAAEKLTQFWLWRTQRVQYSRVTRLIDSFLEDLGRRKDA